ncbi:hypothetical protein [Chelativorans xinjiangense]|uniref:hypothetical protein n=1 Tax=Chelativorans xinjiangense TaxID=2681485 RepID=UPI0013596503|nr:hypothetical protein [Chelativorans xinjiangense]
MDRAKFFAALRRRESGVFGTSLSQGQVRGTEAILDSCTRNRVTDPHYVANILAQVYHETGGYMLPIKETVYASHKDKSPSDATVIARLERAWKAGQLSWVKTPYWREGWFGRGPIQTTHYKNYLKMGTRLGVDLIRYPEELLKPRTGADSAVIGMAEGLYTGRKLSDYAFPEDLSAPPAHHPRRIVNGKDGTDGDIAKYHRAFHSALTAAGHSAQKAPASTREPLPPLPDTPEPETPPTGKSGGKSGIVALVAVIGTSLALFWDKITALIERLF